MTVATLLKAALLAYGLLLGGAFLYVRLYPEVASRTVFEWGKRVIAVSGTLAPADGIDRAWLANVPVELLVPGFGDRLAAIAGETRREVEELAHATAARAREQALAAAQTEFGTAERRLAEADDAVVAASADLIPAAPAPPAPPEPVAIPDPEHDPAVIAAARRLAAARAADEAAKQALTSRVHAFFAERRREQARAQLRVAVRRLTEAEGGGLEIAVDNAGPMAVTQMVLVLDLSGQPVATFGGQAVLASERTPLRFTPEIVNEYNEKILGLPPRFQWRMILPLDRALDGRLGGFSVDVLDAEFAEAARLERKTPYGSSVRVWAYPTALPDDLFAEDFRAAAPRFPEAPALAEAERAVAAAAAGLAQAQAAAEERAQIARRDAARPKYDVFAADRQAKAMEAAARLRAAEAERERLSSQRDEILKRIERIRAGSEAVVLAERVSDRDWQGSLDRIKRSIAKKIAAARTDTRRAETRSDTDGGFRFSGLSAGTYYLYSPLTDAEGATLHYLQRLELREDGGTVFEPPVTMSQEEFLYGIMEAGT